MIFIIMGIFSTYKDLLLELQVLPKEYQDKYEINGVDVLLNPRNIRHLERGCQAILTIDGDFYIATETSVTRREIDSLMNINANNVPFIKTSLVNASELTLISQGDNDEFIKLARTAIKNYRDKNNNLIRFKLSKYGIGM